MSLASCAAPFGEESDNNTNIIQKKRQNQTRKRKHTEPKNSKVTAMMDQIQRVHNNVEGMENNNDDNNFTNNFDPPQSPTNDTLDGSGGDGDEAVDCPQVNSDPKKESFTQLPSTYARDYYQQYIPYHNQMSDDLNSSPNKDELLKKLDYMIHLLEEQQDEKTGSVTEELVLYCFLGVFVIFVVDSFARAGKYVR